MPATAPPPVALALQRFLARHGRASRVARRAAELTPRAADGSVQPIDWLDAIQLHPMAAATAAARGGSADTFARALELALASASEPAERGGVAALGRHGLAPLWTAAFAGGSADVVAVLAQADPPPESPLVRQMWLQARLLIANGGVDAFGGALRWTASAAAAGADAAAWTAAWTLVSEPADADARVRVLPRWLVTSRALRLTPLGLGAALGRGRWPAARAILRSAAERAAVEGAAPSLSAMLAALDSALEQAAPDAAPDADAAVVRVMESLATVVARAASLDETLSSAFVDACRWGLVETGRAAQTGACLTLALAARALRASIGVICLWLRRAAARGHHAAVAAAVAFLANACSETLAAPDVFERVLGAVCAAPDAEAAAAPLLAAVPPAAVLAWAAGRDGAATVARLGSRVAAAALHAFWCGSPAGVRVALGVLVALSVDDARGAGARVEGVAAADAEESAASESLALLRAAPVVSPAGAGGGVDLLVHKLLVDALPVVLQETQEVPHRAAESSATIVGCARVLARSGRVPIRSWFAALREALLGGCASLVTWLLDGGALRWAAADVDTVVCTGLLDDPTRVQGMASLDGVRALLHSQWLGVPEHASVVVPHLMGAVLAPPTCHGGALRCILASRHPPLGLGTWTERVLDDRDGLDDAVGDYGVGARSVSRWWDCAGVLVEAVLHIAPVPGLGVADALSLFAARASRARAARAWWAAVGVEGPPGGPARAAWAAHVDARVRGGDGAAPRSCTVA
jgi:hypothetical protein